MCFGRASTRPYSYAMCAIVVICSLLCNDYQYSYAMIAHASNVGASGSSPAFRPPCLCWVCVLDYDVASFWDRLRVRKACISGELPLAPTATRCASLR
ncbi:MAG: hypothetical protein K2G49_03230 [Muribaculum sp.]|nr:hypothetical protein [Muribaculum sp.]